MNNLVKVHNRNVYPLIETFKGQNIHIPANKYIEMDYDEAVQFKSQYHQPIFDKGGVQDPTSYKYLELDSDDVKRVYRQRGNVGTDEKKEKFVCHVCAKDFLTKKGLLAHIKGKHLEAMVDEDARDELIDSEEIERDET